MGLEVMFHSSHFQRFSLMFSSLFFLFLSLCFHPKFSVSCCLSPTSPFFPTSGALCLRCLHSPVPTSFMFCFWPLSPLGIFATFS